MKRRQQRCADWEELLAVSDPEQNLSPAEYAQLQEHLAQCPSCAALHESYRLMTVHLRALAAAQPLTRYTTERERHKEQLAARIEQLEAGAPSAASPMKPERRNQREHAVRKGMYLGPAFVVAALLLLAFGLFHKPPFVIEAAATVMRTLTGSGGLLQKTFAAGEAIVAYAAGAPLIVAVSLATLGITILCIRRTRETLRVVRLSFPLLTRFLTLFELLHPLLLKRKLERLSIRPGKRSVFVVSAVLLTTLIVTVWVLSTLGIIGGPWASWFSGSVTVLSVVVAIFQWFQPLSFKTRGKTTDAPFITKRWQKHPVEFEGMALGVDEQHGSLVVYTKKHLRGSTVNVCRGFQNSNLMPELASNVIGRKMRNHVVHAAIFPGLQPGNYTVFSESRDLIARVTLQGKQVTEIDWR